MNVTIYTDGACSGNPGPGGYGVVLLADGFRKELFSGFRLTTNNRMELLAVIVGLESLKTFGGLITVYSDSSYVVNAINKGWVFNWEKSLFKKKKNVDLWRRFLFVYQKHTVVFKWVKGHDGNIENECCDNLAVSASKQKNLVADVWYEKNNPASFTLFD